MKARIYGIKRVASEMKHIPSGFHLEIWACKQIESNTYRVWTSALLTPGSWTTYKAHPEYVRIDGLVGRYRQDTEWMEDRTPSITESIRAVIEEVFE